MAKLQKFRDYHYEATVKVSDNTRTLALSAIGIVWLFKEEVGGSYVMPELLKIPILLVLVSMALDFLQYVYRAIVWHRIFRSKEALLAQKKITESEELYVSACVNFLGYCFFYSKVIALSFAYLGLLQFFIVTVKWA
jgi:hypothetical protein